MLWLFLTTEGTNESDWLYWKTCTVCLLTMIKRAKKPLISKFWSVKIATVICQEIFVIFVLHTCFNWHSVSQFSPESIGTAPSSSLFFCAALGWILPCQPLVSAWVDLEPRDHNKSSFHLLCHFSRTWSSQSHSTWLFFLPDTVVSTPGQCNRYKATVGTRAASHCGVHMLQASQHGMKDTYVLNVLLYAAGYFYWGYQYIYIGGKKKNPSPTSSIYSYICNEKI